MTDISLENMDKYLSNILSARYGEEVRGSIHDAIKACANYQKEVGYVSSNDYISRISDQMGIVYVSETDFDNESASGKYYGTTGIRYNTDASWQAVDPFIVPAGEYVFSGLSCRFSFYKLLTDEESTLINMLKKHNNKESLCLRIRFDEPATLYLTSYLPNRSLYNTHPFVISVPRKDSSILYKSNGSVDLLNNHLNYMLGGDRILRTNGEGMHIKNENAFDMSDTLFPNTKLVWTQLSSDLDHGYICTESVDPSGYIVFDYDLDIKDANQSFFDISAVIEKNDGTVQYIPVSRTTGNGSYSKKAILDLNNYAVYNDAKRVAMSVIGRSRNSETPTFLLTAKSYPYWTENVTVSDRYDMNVKTWLSKVDRYLSSLKVSDNSNSMLLTSPNGSKYQISVNDSGDLSAIPVIPTKAYYFGNSLLTGFGPFGMAADDRNSDYYALINAFIKQKNAAFESVGKFNIAEWEGMTNVPNANSWVDTNIISKIDATFDLIVVQACDNCNTEEKKKIFPETSLYLMQKIRSKCPKARVVWIASWFGQDLVDSLSENAEKSGVELIDIREYYGGSNNSHLGAVYSYGESVQNWQISVSEYEDDPESKTLTFTVSGASSSSTIHYESYEDKISTDGMLHIRGSELVVSSSGVAMHPSTRGFKCIANKFLYETGISDIKETYPID